MWNYSSIDKTPTVNQVKSIIKYMESNLLLYNIVYDFSMMMDMSRPKPNIIILNLNNAYSGMIFEVLFSNDGKIESFELTSEWIS